MRVVAKVAAEGVTLALATEILGVRGLGLLLKDVAGVKEVKEAKAVSPKFQLSTIGV
jgi:hypothetical protein